MVRLQRISPACTTKVIGINSQAVYIYGHICRFSLSYEDTEGLLSQNYTYWPAKQNINLTLSHVKAKSRLLVPAVPTTLSLRLLCSTVHWRWHSWTNLARPCTRQWVKVCIYYSMYWQFIHYLWFIACWQKHINKCSSENGKHFMLPRLTPWDRYHSG